MVTRTVTPVAGPAGAVRRGGPNPYHRLSNEEVPPPGQGYAPPPAGMYRGECRPEAAKLPHTPHRFLFLRLIATSKVFLISAEICLMVLNIAYIEGERGFRN